MKKKTIAFKKVYVKSMIYFVVNSLLILIIVTILSARVEGKRYHLKIVLHTGIRVCGKSIIDFEASTLNNSTNIAVLSEFSMGFIPNDKGSAIFVIKNLVNRSRINNPCFLARTGDSVDRNFFWKIGKPSLNDSNQVAYIAAFNRGRKEIRNVSLR